MLRDKSPRRIGENSPIQSKPTRFVMAVAEDTERWGWRVVVRSNDESLVRSLAGLGKVITECDVMTWIKESWPPPRRPSTSWPTSFPPDEFARFLSALNILRVTRSYTTDELQKLTQARAEAAQRFAKVREAIDLLSKELPILLSRADRVAASHSGFYRHTPEQLFRLANLAAVAEDARGIIVAPTPAAREATWHETAQFLEWHLRSLLDLVGWAKKGIHQDGQMAGVIGKALVATEGHHTSPDALSKALSRSEKDKRWILAREQIEGSGYVIAA
jgi:hypothetical protein